MPTYINIPDDQKRTPLQVALTSITTELYRILLEASIDPDTVDLENPLSNNQVSALSVPESPGAYMVDRIKQLCDAYILTKQKLDNLTQ